MSNMARLAFLSPYSLLRHTRRTNISHVSKSARRLLMTSPSPLQKPLPTPPTQKPALKLLYDGECPLCLKEVNFLRERSAKHGNALDFVDIASEEYDPASHAGVTYEVAMGRIHAIDGEGGVVTGVKVFRDAYQAVGLGWVYAITRVPGVSWLAERVYDLWADRRLQLTGRPSLVEILRDRQRSCRE